jgi:demethylmenaquinone methyltransferase/2-methoxy-6-polyprenyl-1,4-benzoquinol methylase
VTVVPSRRRIGHPGLVDPGDAGQTLDVVESQKRFYDLRAPDYLTGAPSDRIGADHDTGISSRDRCAIVDALDLTGLVLELGCGPGGFTRELAARARSVTAVDSSSRMLARNESEVDQSNVHYIHADVFEWVPDAVYDVVFFGFLLSHVPPRLFESFWRLVRACLRPGGQVAFVDEDDRVSHYDDVRLADGVPVARRRLADGREFDIVKVFWEPQELAAELRDLGWRVTVGRIGDAYLYGAGTYVGP